MPHNIGFISTRFAGTDGVSLEIEKWASVLERNTYNCFYLSGENDRPPEKCMLVEEAHFQHPDILAIHDHCYGHHVRSPDITKTIHELREYFKKKIYEFIRDHSGFSGKILNHAGWKPFQDMGFDDAKEALVCELIHNPPDIVIMDSFICYSPRNTPATRIFWVRIIPS